MHSDGPASSRPGTVAPDEERPALSRMRPAAVEAIGWGWRHAGRRAFAVSGLDLSIPAGQRVLLLGPSGAGKSTLLRALAGVLGGSDEGEQLGTLTVAGEPVGEHGRSRPDSGLVLQDPESQVVLARCGDDVAFGCENLGVPREQIWPRVRESLAAVGLGLPLDHPTAALSGGQKQRLALAGVLAMRPGLVLLDEPTANLDPEGVVEVRNAVASAVAGTGATLVVVEHRVGVWKDFVDRVVVLDPGGGVLADGDPAEILVSRGEQLAASGVWVPGFPPAAPVRRRPPASLRARPARPEREPATGSTDPGGERSRGTTLLRARGLAVGRGARRRRRRGSDAPSPAPRGGEAVAEAIDLTVSAGSCLVINGPNGAGKSTLALTLAGLIPPVAGTLEAAEALARGAGASPEQWRSGELLTRVGFVFQDPEHQFLAGTVADELLVGPKLLGMPEAERKDRLDKLLDRLHLSRLARANPFTLSGGEKRRLSVATALATAPQLLILDEPTFGQDSRTWSELTALLAELLDQGSAVVAVSHDEEFAEALADERLHLRPREAFA